MRNRQRGLSLVNLILVGFVLVIVAIFGMKLIPAFIEYHTAKKAIYAIATEGNPSVADVRRSFYNRSVIDNIEVIKKLDRIVDILQAVWPAAEREILAEAA